jgi:methyltransferase
MELMHFSAVALRGGATTCVLLWHPSQLLGAIFYSLPIQLNLTLILFLLLLLAVAVMRIFELRISKRHQQDMTARGAEKVKDPNFRWMAMFHTLVLIGAAAEVLFLHRPFLPALAIPMLAIFLIANIVRWWVIRTLGEHWNVQVMDSTRLGVITTGPFRYVRHPNYAAVFVEMIALPLIHTAWITALAGAVAHIIVLALRLSTEERVLFANPDYAAAMSSKPRFLPGLF